MRADDIPYSPPIVRVSNSSPCWSRPISPNSILITGAQTTVAILFHNMARRTMCTVELHNTGATKVVVAKIASA